MDVDKILKANATIKLLAKRRGSLLRQILRKRARLATASLTGKQETIQLAAATLHGLRKELNTVNETLDVQKAGIKSAMQS